MKREAGFTLIELLVTMTLLSFIFLLVFGGLHFGVRAWDGATAHDANTEDLRVVQALLRRTLEQAYPAYDNRDPTAPVIDFSGGSDWVSFLAPAPQSAATPGRARITIFAARSSGETQLAMRASPELAVGGAGSWTAPLLRNIAAVRFSYFVDGHWVSNWKPRKTMPRLIRIHVAFRDNRRWPDMIVAPLIAADAGCVYDLGSHDCAGRS